MSSSWLPLPPARTAWATCIAGEGIQPVRMSSQNMDSAVRPAETDPLLGQFSVARWDPGCRFLSVVARNYDDMMTGLQRCDVP